MSKQEMDNLFTVSELSALRWLAKHKCSTDQGIRSQIRELEDGKKKPADVGFEVVRVTNTLVLIRLVDKELESFRLKAMEFAEKNAPKEK